MDIRCLMFTIFLIYLKNEESSQSEECTVQLLRYKWYNQGLCNSNQNLHLCENGFYFEVEPLANARCHDVPKQCSRKGSYMKQSANISKEQFFDKQYEIDLYNSIQHSGSRLTFTISENTTVWVFRACSNNAFSYIDRFSLSFWCLNTSSDANQYTINGTDRAHELQFSVLCSKVAANVQKGGDNSSNNTQRASTASEGEFESTTSTDKVQFKSTPSTDRGYFDITKPTDEGEHQASVRLAIMIPVSIVVVGLIAPLILIIYQKKYRA